MYVPLHSYFNSTVQPVGTLLAACEDSAGGTEPDAEESEMDEDSEP